MADSRRTKSNLATAKAKLNKFQSDLEQVDYVSGTLGAVTTQKMDTNWAIIALACGSNAFNQIHMESMDLMRSTFDKVSLPSSSIVEGVACGSNMSCVTVSGKDQSIAYFWGNGIPGSSPRVPTPLPIKGVVKVSCGQNHAALISTDGHVFTWGSGDNGMLGHGSRQAVNSPKPVSSMAKMFCFDVSCGGFHTAFLAVDRHRARDIQKIRFPTGDGDHEYLSLGSLLTCGLAKAGQLGLGKATNMVATPTLVTSLEGDGLLVAKVSCGFHHTLVIACPPEASSFTSFVFACGWGDGGRLGLGDEEQRPLLTCLEFPEHFLPTEVSAGEQHSMAASRVNGTCYCWGNNDMGQLGVGSPSLTPFVALPARVPIPDGTLVTKIAAGGRHSAALTKCGKLLTWGWGEEGQLGHGSERNSHLPRPCKIPRIKGDLGVPVDVSLGMAHSLVVLRNNSYRGAMPIQEPVAPPPTPPQKEEVEEVEVRPPEVESSDVLKEEPPPVFEPEPELEPSFFLSDNTFEPEPEPEVEPPTFQPKAPVIEEEEEEERPLVAVRSIKELLTMREERNQMRRVPTPVKSPEPSPPPPDPSPPPREPTPPRPQSPEAKAVAVEVEDEEVPDLSPRARQEAKIGVYYKEGQSTDKCLVANSAKRAELRRLKKEQQQQQQQQQQQNATSSKRK